jgi:hypothetical protein
VRKGFAFVCALSVRDQPQAIRGQRPLPQRVAFVVALSERDQKQVLRGQRPLLQRVAFVGALSERDQPQALRGHSCVRSVHISGKSTVSSILRK